MFRVHTLLSGAGQHVVPTPTHEACSEVGHQACCEVDGFLDTLPGF